MPGSRRTRPDGRRAQLRRDGGAEPTREGRLLVVAGLALEARGLLRRLPPATRRRLSVRTVGMGAASLSKLDVPPGSAAVLVTGLAGGCAPDLGPGDIVVADSVTVPGAGSAGGGTHPGLRLRATRALDVARVRYRVGRLLTVDDVVTSAADKARWWGIDGALAVDMESVPVLAWARRAGLPALAVRAIADGPSDEVPREVLGVMGPDGRMRPGAAARLLGRPALAGALWRLGARSRRALGSLARFVQAFVDLPDEP